MTIRELVRAAMRVANILAAGETPTAADENDVFEAFKIMLREWSYEGDMVYCYTEDSHVLTAGTSSYTIGSGATIDTIRPVQIKGAYVQEGGYDYPLKIIGDRKYREIADKDAGFDYPAWLHYKPDYVGGLGTIFLWPPGGGTLYFHSMKPLSEFANLTDNFTVPGEYEQAVKFNLACDICPEFGKEPGQWMVKRAADSKRTISSINAALSINTVEPEVLYLTRRYHINEG